MKGIGTFCAFEAYMRLLSGQGLRYLGAHCLPILIPYMVLAVVIMILSACLQLMCWESCVNGVLFLVGSTRKYTFLYKNNYCIYLNITLTFFS